MTKRTKALSGASQDAYFRRVFKTHSSLSPEERDRLVHFLRREIAQLRLRRKENIGVEASKDSLPAADTPGAQSLPSEAAASETPTIETQPVEPPARVAAAPPFDPFSLNIVLLVRKGGREGALSALEAIDDLDNLRLLAREQRLSVAAGLSSTQEMRAAIVQAAERRIANRIAAAS